MRTGKFFYVSGLAVRYGGEGGIRTHVGRNAPNRFRVGAVMTASVPLQETRVFNVGQRYAAGPNRSGQPRRADIDSTD